MKKENIKSDESVKAGLKIEANKNSSDVNKDVTDDRNEENDDADISATELELLDESGKEETDDEQLKTGDLDNTDEDGELLNESSFGKDKTGRDLDVPGSEDDDDMEDIGEEDEENNPYSLSDNSD